MTRRCRAIFLQSGTSPPGFSIFTRRLNSLHGIVTQGLYTVIIGKRNSCHRGFPKSRTGYRFPPMPQRENVFSPLFSFPLSKSAGFGSSCLPALFPFFQAIKPRGMEHLLQCKVYHAGNHGKALPSLLTSKTSGAPFVRCLYNLAQRQRGPDLPGLGPACFVVFSFPRKSLLKE